MKNRPTLFRASILHFTSSTIEPDNHASYYHDGALVVEDSHIVALGEYQDIHVQYSQSKVQDYRGRLIIPGLIDSHLHFPQTEMIAKYGQQLLAWLENYTFPTENKFVDRRYCEYIAQTFIRELVSNGTTTAFAYATAHKQSVDALFSVASQYNMAMITGKVCMDRHCPDYLQDSPQSAQEDSHALIEKWHGSGRNLYALTPRFAPTSSPQQLALLGELAKQYPSVFVQTHLSENQGEIEWVKDLFPQHKTYLDVYDHYNMVHSRSLFGHCLHLHDHEWERLAEAKANAIFCPSSNLFLGSGLFSLQQASKYKVNVALATDVGAGTSFNMLNTYGEAYKIGQLQQFPLSALHGLYMMTQGPASAYGLDQDIGNLNPGSYADFVVLNPQFDALSKLRCESLLDQDITTEKSREQKSMIGADILFALSFIGDDRAVEATYIAGKELKQTLQEQVYAMA